MSADEKAANPTYKITGGYLKKLDYKEAHAIWWSKLSAEDKAKITGLPNFDADKFKTITGIDVSESKEDKRITLVKTQVAELKNRLNELEAELENRLNELEKELDK